MDYHLHLFFIIALKVVKRKVEQNILPNGFFDCKIRPLTLRYTKPKCFWQLACLDNDTAANLYTLCFVQGHLPTNTLPTIKTVHSPETNWMKAASKGINVNFA